jgi:AsmA protein
MRILLKIIAIVVILVVAGLIALPFVVDPNDYKQQISDQVEKATGRTLSLDGDIGLSVFPWVALELGPLSLSNAAGFDAEHFAKIDAAQVRIKLMPLLQKKLEMDTIVLDGLVLNLEKNKAGSTNWDDLGQSADKKAEDNTPSNTSDESSGAGLAALSIAGVELTNANIIWSDKASEAHYNIENFNLNTDPLEPGKPTAIEMDFDLSSTEPQMTAHIALESQLAVDLEKQLYTLSDLSFKTQAEGHALPLPKIDLAISGDVNADLENQTVDLSQLLIQIQELAIESTINASQVLSDNPSFNGSLTIKPFNLRQLAKQLAIELPIMADDSTLELVQLNSQLSGSDDHINLNDLQLKLDQSVLTGELAVKHFDKPAISFKLALDEIDADRYMPPVIEGGETNAAHPSPTPTATTAAATASQLPLETLRALNLKGSFDIGKLKVSGTHSDNIHINIAANKGVIKLQPMTANLYQGQYKGNVNLDARGKSLKLSLDENLSNVQAGPLLKDLSGDDKVSGVVSGKIKLSGQGKTSDQIKQTLSGNGNFSFTDGALKGFNIADSIRKAKAVLKGQSPTATTEAAKTDFSSLTGSFNAKNGVINNQDLALMSPLLRIKGAGTADLAKEVIDYTLGVSIVETSKGQQGKELADLKGLTIPVKISGSFNDPKPTVDLATLFKDNAEAKINEKLDAEKARLKDKVTEKLSDKLGSELGGLLGGGFLGNKKADPETEPSAEESQSDTPPAKSSEDELIDMIGGKFNGLL